MLLSYIAAISQSNIAPLPTPSGSNTCDSLAEIVFPNGFLYDDPDDVLDINRGPFSVPISYEIHYSNGDNILRKPFIYVEGFDWAYSSSCDDVYNGINIPGDNLNNFLHELRTVHGYDIVILNLFFPRYPLEFNSRMLRGFINAINEQKQGSEKNVVMGISMGGLLLRTALAEVEEFENYDHQTRLLISYDSPQSGAIAPISLQTLVYHVASLTAPFQSLVPSLSEFSELFHALDLPAARQMLLHHVRGHTGVNTPLQENTARTNFNSYLDGLSCQGYPAGIKNIAVSNGSMIGQDQLDNNGNQSNGVALRVIGPWPFTFTLNTSKWHTNEYFAKNNTVWTMQGTDSRDWLPGGYFPWFEIAHDVFQQIPSYSIQYYFRGNSSFIPTFSAFGLNESYEDVNWTSNIPYFKSKSPFDDILIDPNQTANMRHTELDDGSSSTGIYNYLINQITTGENSDYRCKYTNLNLDNENWNQQNYDFKFYKASNTINVSNSYFANNKHFELIAGNEITFNGETVISGVEDFVAKIEPCPSSKACNTTIVNNGLRKSSLKDNKEGMITNPEFISNHRIYPSILSIGDELKFESSKKIKSNDLSFNLLDSEGQLISEIEFTKIDDMIFSANLPNISQGMYLITNSEMSILQKIIIK